tara:strand:+ start:529 stop:1221 length:693 start_codon:yes stop_codon:yes gene_type:complete
MYSRYAIYFTPPPGVFACLGAAWLGWDIKTGTTAHQPDYAGVDINKITQRPRKYGLHGTIKAPFRLADGQTETGLANALETFCSGREPFVLDGLTLSKIGRFLALTPQGNPSALVDLAGDAVENFERFRAPLSDDELARKNSPALTEKQRIYLNTFGYPYVKEYFRFHITLTGPLSPDQSSSVSTLLLDYLQPACLRPFTIDSLSLCGEASNGYFHEIDRFALGKATNSV